MIEEKEIKEPVQLHSEIVVGTYVAALYDKKVYIGKIIEVDEDDKVEISVMENVRRLLQWPKKKIHCGWIKARSFVRCRSLFQP